MTQQAPIALQSALADLHDAEFALDEFVTTNALIIDKYRELQAHLEEAEKKVKDLYLKHADKVGNRFDRFKIVYKRTVNVNRFKDLMDKQNLDWAPFMEVKESLTLKMFDAGVDSGLIPESIVKEVIDPYGHASVQNAKR